MASPGRGAGPGLRDLLLQRPYDFNFFQGQDFYTANSPTSPTAGHIVPAIDNTIRGNAIYANRGLGIDVPAGSNLPTPPTILAVGTVGSSTGVTGRLSGLGNTAVTVDLYASVPSTDPAVPVQGAR